MKILISTSVDLNQESYNVYRLKTKWNIPFLPRIGELIMLDEILGYETIRKYFSKLTAATMDTTNELKARVFDVEYGTSEEGNEIEIVIWVDLKD